ncbi:MAG: type IV pilus assembly protein PilM [Armatimonadota bacterium]|nr:type IV pilus assembly protein PilM [Armatimonadota bacterium]
MFDSRKKQNGPAWTMGIDLGHYALKAVLLEETADSIVAHYAAYVPTPTDAIRQGVIVHQREVAAQIKKLVRQSGSGIRAASIAIPIEQLVVRSLELPDMKADELRQATRFEARKYLPFPAETAEIVIAPMGQTLDSEGVPHLRALLAAAPREVVRSRAETLEMAGLEVAAVEIEPVALMRAFHVNQSSRNTFWLGQPCVHLHLGQKSSGMCVVQDTHLRFVHKISWGSFRLTQALATSLSCTVAEAQAIEESPDAVLNPDGTFAWGEADKRQETRALAPELERLSREMQRLLNYYRSLFPERSYEGILDRLILSGGRADLRGLHRFFSEMFQIEVVARNPFQTFETHLSGSSFAAIEGRNHCFAVAIGLALGDLHRTARTSGAKTGQPREFVWRKTAAAP